MQLDIGHIGIGIGIGIGMLFSGTDAWQLLVAISLYCSTLGLLFKDDEIRARWPSCCARAGMHDATSQKLRHAMSA